ncbi:MAG: cation:proton antiporter [Bacillota bacterium]|nr:cation:proton antiporter [Bacillota bacterium]
MKKNIKVKDSIIKSCANITLPMALVLGIYIILHGHLSPGGGFQGGVIIAGAAAIVFIAYGYKEVFAVFNMEKVKISEDIGAIGYIFVAVLGLIYGFDFCTNVIWHGIPGKLYSSGTIFWMNFAVGFKVTAGIGFLIIMMVANLYQTSEYEDEDIK